MQSRTFCAAAATVIVVFGAAAAAQAYKPYFVRSPNGKIRVQVSELGGLTYSIRRGRKVVLLDSRIRAEFAGGLVLGENTKVTDAKITRIKKTWKPPFGKHSEVLNHCNELRLMLKVTGAAGKRFEVIFRVFDDGVAFRYVIPRQEGLDKFILTKEGTEFHFAGDHTAWFGDYKDFKSHQEARFPKSKLSAITAKSVIGVPSTIRIDDKLYVAITEAALVNWAGMYLARAERKGDKGVCLVTKLSPSKDAIVRAATPHHSPWRVIMISERPGGLIESEIIENLNGPCAIDPSWIKPGKMAWDHWWSGDVKMDTETLKEYIQLASDMGWPYQMVDWHWYGKPEQSDCTTPAPQVDMPALLKFAKQRNVRLWLWINWKDCDRKYKQAFPLYQKWGIAGVKIDFMIRDDQEMVNWYHKVVKKAAEHRLMVNFHGCYKPTGVRRTYPNLITREGVMGNEHTKWSTDIQPPHNVTIPFTRMLAGQMDFTPGAFLQVTKQKFVPKQLPARVMGTRCHQLAMFVVYESPITCICDHPRHYKGQGGADFLKVVPTVWDDIRVLTGEIGEHVTIAKRSGDDWYLGAMTNWDARELKVPLSFLGRGQYTAEIWKDAPDSAANPTKVFTEERSVSARDTFTIKMVSGGGTVVRLTPHKE